ncbi:MAG: MFS transporter [Actinomycetaceae bacterium]|nr:MFS transporter [Actinomycetaceae bacterium]
MTSRPTALKARIGISLFFFTNGALIAGLLPRYPQIKEAYGLSNTQFGLVVAAIAVGSVGASAFPAPLIKRFGAQKVALVGTALMALSLACAGVAPALTHNIAPFVIALACAGFTDAAIDAAQNVHGVKVEDAYGKTIINSLHALWSLGAASGGAIGTLAAHLGIPLGWHLSVMSALIFFLGIVATVLGKLPDFPDIAEGDKPTPQSHKESTTPEPKKRTSIGVKVAILLGLLTIAGVLAEDFASNWSALFLKDIMSASVGVAGAGYVVLIISQFIGRILGDPSTDKWGAVAVIRVGGLMIAAGGILVVMGVNVPMVLVGYALAGYGCATVVPTAYAASGRIPGLAPGTGITIVGWMLRVCFLLASPIIGALSDLIGLRLALSLIAISGVAVVLLANTVRPRTAD